MAELVVKQLTTNGLMSCVADNRKVIQISHVMNTSREGFNKQFTLHNLVVNLDTYKKAEKYLSSNVLDVDSLEYFKLVDVPTESQMQFKHYISEICREVRNDLADTLLDTDGSPMEVYRYINVSKSFKNFCSVLVSELLIRLSTMMHKEIESRNIKTVNDVVVSTVLSHYHTACGLSETDSFNYIRNVSDKYQSYVLNKPSKLSTSKLTTAV